MEIISPNGAMSVTYLYFWENVKDQPTNRTDMRVYREVTLPIL